MKRPHLTANSLRVGNNILFNGMWDIVEEISKDGHIFCKKNKYGMVAKEITSIPLTLDIIQDLGFYKSDLKNVYYSTNYNYSIEITDSGLFNFYIRYTDYYGNSPEDICVATVQYLDQLENIFYFNTWNEIDVLQKNQEILNY
jgi:hypothetical protein